MTPEEIRQMNYVDFMARLNEVNRPPGGKDAVRILVQNSFLNSQSRVLDIGCNSGYCAFEINSLSKCRVIGIDINNTMLHTAMRFREYYKANQNQIHFLQGDALKLPFPNNTFDLVVSGGSTAFMPDISFALQEYARVTKDWGFVGDINFFYHELPPQTLIDELNNLMNIEIQPWTVDFWHEIYVRANLEMYFSYFGQMQPVKTEKLIAYCEALVSQHNWKIETRQAALQRLIEIMELFNENHKYLSFGLFIMRKRTFNELTLF